MPKVLALKEAGTHPVAEGMLARFAEVRSIRTRQDAASAAAAAHPGDLFLIDLAMPNLDVMEVLGAMNLATVEGPAVLLLDLNQQPGRLRRRLSQIASLSSEMEHGFRLNLGEIVRLFGISQETLARILSVSTRTAHRWIKGARPRQRPELAQLRRIVELLRATLPNEASIRTYLHHPNPLLKGEAPIVALARGEFERIAADLEAAQEGVYA